MNREEARKAAEVMLAYAEGKEIEKQRSGNWVITKDPPFDWLCSNYRVKPEPKYRPFRNAEERLQEMLKHQPFGWVKSKKNGTMRALIGMDDDSVWMADAGIVNRLLNAYEFIDGTPFGIKEEE